MANAVLLPHVLEAYGEAAHEKLAELAIAAGLVSRAESAKDGAEAMIHALQEMKLRLDIPDVIPEIQEKDIPALARIAAKEANPLYPVPRLMTEVELGGFYRQIAAAKAVHHGKQAS